MSEPANKDKNVKNTREKVCLFCKSKTEPKWADYENLKEYLSTRGRILSREVSYVCVKHQRRLAEAIKQARHLALLPFVATGE
jgi:small subunit ribosomal protein S18